jgi:hypothetical protein
VIDSYASIVLKRLPKVIPKREVSNFAHLQRPERIRIAHTQQSQHVKDWAAVLWAIEHLPTGL